MSQTSNHYVITSRLEDEVIVMSIKEYRKLKGKKRSLKEHLLNAPKIDDFDISRVKGRLRGRDLLVGN